MYWFIELTVTGLTDDLSGIYEKSESPAEYHSGSYSRVDGQQRTDWWIEAETATTALDHALQLWKGWLGDKVPPQPDTIKITSDDELEHAATTAAASELISISEVGRLLGVSHQRASKLAKTDPSFPPGFDVGGGRHGYPRWLVNVYVAARREKLASRDPVKASR